jgi:hypothetical protein
LSSEVPYGVGDPGDVLGAGGVAPYCSITVAGADGCVVLERGQIGLFVSLTAPRSRSASMFRLGVQALIDFLALGDVDRALGRREVAADQVLVDLGQFRACAVVIGDDATWDG